MGSDHSPTDSETVTRGEEREDSMAGVVGKVWRGERGGGPAGTEAQKELERGRHGAARSPWEVENPLSWAQENHVNMQRQLLPHKSFHSLWAVWILGKCPWPPSPTAVTPPGQPPALQSPPPPRSLKVIGQVLLPRSPSKKSPVPGGGLLWAWVLPIWSTVSRVWSLNMGEDPTEFPSVEPFLWDRLSVSPSDHPLSRPPPDTGVHHQRPQR